MTTEVKPRRPYRGGRESTELRHSFMALYQQVKSRRTTMKMLDLFWPDNLGYPPQYVLSQWYREVEDGTAIINKRVADWVRGQVEESEMLSLREAGMEAARTFTHFTKKMREENKPPPGGVVALKYLADAAGFQLGKRAEILQAKQPKQAITIGTLELFAPPPPKSLASDSNQVMEAEFSEVDLADGD